MLITIKIVKMLNELTLEYIFNKYKIFKILANLNYLMTCHINYSIAANYTPLSHLSSLITHPYQIYPIKIIKNYNS